ncbi:MFS quinate transporter [Hortaea werneckii]|nr:MFS quinate transporter [Hortaea werneckii]
MGGSNNLIARTSQAVRDTPREVFNFYLFFCNAIVSLSGVAKGFDEGNIASVVVMEVFKKRFGLGDLNEDQYASTKGWIVSIATAGAVFGCLSCTWLNTCMGRRRVLQLFTIIYVAGILGQTLCDGSLGGMYGSRIVAGFGIGGTTVVPSVYLSEIAPKSIRGLVTVQYACCQQLGVVLGFFINYGVTKHHEGTNVQWMLPTALQLVPAVIWGAGSLFVVESPRYLLSANRKMEAVRSLERLRKLPIDHPMVAAELDAMQSQIDYETESVAGIGVTDMLKETMVSAENRRRFMLMFMAHTFGQWSGANAITQYSPTIFGYLGVPSGELRFLTTGVYGLVKFSITFCFSVLIVDFVGRRRSLFTGISLQIITLTFVGAYLGVTTGMSSEEIEQDPNLSRTSTAAIVAIFFHAVGWSIGWFSMPYLINSEIFPTRIRSFNMSIFMALHWAWYFGCSKAMPSLLAATDRYGAFAFFASICVCSLIFAFLCMPETAGRSLESLDALFQRPLYTIWKVAYPTDEDVAQISAVPEEKTIQFDAKHYENAGKEGTNRSRV